MGNDNIPSEKKQAFLTNIRAELRKNFRAAIAAEVTIIFAFLADWVPLTKRKKSGCPALSMIWLKRHMERTKIGMVKHGTRSAS